MRTRNLTASLGLVLAVSVVVPVLRGQMRSVVGGVAVNGLRISIGPAYSGSSGRLPPTGGRVVVTLANEGDKDFVVNLGSMLANGKVMWPEALRLLLTGPDAVTRELQFADRRYGAVAGRLDDFIVPMRSGSSYALLLSLDDFYSPATKEFALALVNGSYRISARFQGGGAKKVNLDMQGVPLLNFWTGTAQSNVVEFSVGR